MFNQLINEGIDEILNPNSTHEHDHTKIRTPSANITIKSNHSEIIEAYDELCEEGKAWYDDMGKLNIKISTTNRADMRKLGLVGQLFDCQVNFDNIKSLEN